MIGTTSTTTVGVTSTVTTAPQGMRPDVSIRETQSTSTITGKRLTSPPPVSRTTETTAPVGLATPISQDLLWPGHKIYKELVYFPEMMIHLLWQLEDWILKKDGKFITHMIFQESEDPQWKHQIT